MGLSRNCQGPIKCVVINTCTVVVKRLVGVLLYPDAILKKVENGANVEKVPFSEKELIFLNRKDEIFDWGNGDLSELKAAEERPKLIQQGIHQ